MRPEETVTAIERAGGSAFAIGVDLRRPGAAETLWKEFDRHADGLDILVNRAGIGNARPIEEIDESEYDQIFTVNVKAPFFLAEHSLDHCVPEAGSSMSRRGPHARQHYPRAWRTR